jgi:hypothetical protein
MLSGAVMKTTGPAVVFSKRSGGILATAHAGRIPDAQVVKKFDDRKQYDAFVKGLRRDGYGQLATTPFSNLVHHMFGESAMKRVGGHLRPNLTQDQVKKLMDVEAVTKQLRKHADTRMGDDGVCAQAARIAKAAGFALRNFQVLDAHATKDGVKRDGHLLSNDVSALLINTDLR